MSAFLRDVAAVLLLAAAGKTYSLLAADGQNYSSLSIPLWLVYASIGVEWLLGGWLLLGILPHAAWLSSIVCFSVFLCLSLVAGMKGNEVCGCFGFLSTSPWLTALMDASILAALCVFRQPNADPERNTPTDFGGSYSPVRVGCLLLAVSTASVVFAKGILAQAKASEDSENAAPQLVADASSNDVRNVNLGKLKLGEEPEYTFAIRNTTSKPFTVTAIRKSCGCQTTGAREGTVVPAGGVLEIPYALPNYRSKVQTGRLVITTDSIDDSFKEIVLTLRAEIPQRLWATPSVVLFDAAKEGDSEEKELRIESDVPGLLEQFQEVTTTRELVTVELKQKTRETLIFRVALSSKASVDEAHDFINLRFDDIDDPQFNIRVRVHRAELSHDGGPSFLDWWSKYSSI